MDQMFHTTIRPVLSEGSTWAAIGGALGTQLPAPVSYIAFTAAAAAFIAAALLRDKGGRP